MTRKKRAAPRCEEILQLLGTHHALSPGTIHSMMDPPVSRRRIRNILLTLIRDGTVSRRTFRMHGGHSVFYELATPDRVRLNIPRVYSANLIHSDFCALAHMALLNRFPNARFYREHTIGRLQELRAIMNYEVGAPDSLPDILMVIPSAISPRPVYVAVEIERMAKSESRLLRKFSKYAVRTQLDGVIYLSEDRGLLKLLRNFYRTRIIKEARRIAHYPKHFLLTGPCPTRADSGLSLLQNAEDIPVYFENWIHKLADTHPSLRRDVTFDNYTPVGIDNSCAASSA